MNLDIWIFFAVIAVAFKSTYYLLQKKYLDDDVSPYTTAYISSVYGSVLIAPLAVWDIVMKNIEITWALVGILIAFGIVESLYLLVYLFALNNLNLSIASPFKKSKPAVLAFVEPIILSTILSPLIAIAAIFTAFGGVLTVVGSSDSLDTYKKDITKIGLFFAVLTVILSTAMSLISRFGASQISPFVFGFGVSVTMMFVTRFLIYHNNITRDSITVRSKNGFYLGFVGALRSISVWIAYSLAAATAVSTITQATLILDTLLAKYYLEEDITRVQTVGISIIFIATLVVIMTT